MEKFKAYLVEQERSEATIEKYMRDVRKFVLWLDKRELNNALDISSVNANTFVGQDLTATYQNTSAEAFGIAYDTQSLTLNSQISMTTYFELASGASIGDYSFTLTYTQGQNEYTKVLEASKEADGRYSLTIEDIPVAYWDYMYTIKVTKTNETGAYVVKSSVLGWAKRCIEEEANGNEAEANMARAMYYYNKYANEYFGR